ncbi:IPT/TIG domain-containing protein [Streptomyces antimycoticus]|uniref:IPT/TIG domain-containing protein n=1 Tax=Streptomyces antimycoticus TaxID=68175 RepID=A0ABD5JJ17_9ACTN|nr:IPT/TIG domain-containing protein [Streptomyces sp. DSM 41602]
MSTSARPLAGGNTVTINGTGLSTATAVNFGGTAVAPPGSGTVQITAVTPGGTSNGVPYTYVAVPVLTSLSPTEGPLNTGTTVTLFIRGLTTTSTVLFDTTHLLHRRLGHLGDRHRPRAGPPVR